MLAASLSTSHVEKGTLEWGAAGSVPGNVLQHGPVRSLAVSSNGLLVWLLTGTRVAFATSVNSQSAAPPLLPLPQSTTNTSRSGGDKRPKVTSLISLDGKWVDVAKDVLCFAIDNTCAWYVLFIIRLQIRQISLYFSRFLSTRKYYLLYLLLTRLVYL